MKISPLSTLLSTTFGVVIPVLSSTTTRLVGAQSACVGDESELIISVMTSGNQWEHSWHLEKLNENDNWVEVAYNDLYGYMTLCEDTECLEPNSTYKWTLKDTAGDGMCKFNYGCGYSSVVLNGEEILSNDGNIGYEDWVIFVTPSDPSLPALVTTNEPSVSPSFSPSDSSLPSATPSESNAPSSSPTDCDGDTLIIEVGTDVYPWENYWILEVKDETTGDYSTVQSNELPVELTLYTDYVCLETGRLYRWTLFDTYGDGISCFMGCGSYSLTLNGEKIVTTGTFTYEVVREIGAVECVDEYPGVHTINYPSEQNPVSVTCRAINRNINFSSNPTRSGWYACDIGLADGSGIVADKCKDLCAGYGKGPCAM